MAQEKRSRMRRVRVLARRYGITGKRGVATACVVLVVLFGVMGYTRLSSSSITIQRGANDSRHEPDSTTNADGKAYGSEPDSSSGDTGQKKTDAKGEDGDGEEQRSTEVWVHVDGAVANPGVYALGMSVPRVNDAIARAGGLAEDADTTTLNLAASVTDGQKVYVPHKGEESPPSQGDGNAGATSTPSAATDAGPGPININTATETELQELPGVGEATAAAIVEERQSGGLFSAPEDIMRVSGIGEKKFAKIKDRICV